MINGTQVVLEILDRELVAAPVWFKGGQAKNWAATITAVGPGPFRREFWNHTGPGSPHHYVVPDTLQLGAVVEFSADRPSGTGRLNRRRCGVVEALSDTQLTLAQYDGVTSAWRAAMELEAGSEAAELEAARGRLRAAIRGADGEAWRGALDGVVDDTASLPAALARYLLLRMEKRLTPPPPGARRWSEGQEAR